MTEDKTVRVLKALADTKRFRMVQEVAAAGEMSCGQLGEKFTLSQPTISHHLKILLDANVLVSRQHAQIRYLTVNVGLLERLSVNLPVQLKRRPSPIVKEET